MGKTTWTEKRLARLFQRYNKKYWNGKLPEYSVKIDTTFPGAFIQRKNRLIRINTETK